MFTTISTYFLMLFLIFWCYCGYIILLSVLTTLNPKTKKKETISTTLPRITIIVPCHNEESYVKQKVNNLKDLEYKSDKLEIFFLNGPSTDNTAKEIVNLIGDMPNWHLIETGCTGKINQINYGLSKISNDADIIVSTDMDTLLSADTLIKIANEFNADKRVAVVGANISPQDCILIEETYWRDQNLLRMMESSVYTSSIVVAPCYAYKTFLIKRFPRDCIADDIYIAFKANTEGYLTKYLPSPSGIELRVPTNLEGFFRHKFRKGNAYIRELYRFFYCLPRMSGWWKLIYLTKVLQLAIIPWILPYFLLSTLSLALSGGGLFQIAFLGLFFLFTFLLITSFIMKKCRLKYLNISKSMNLTTISSFIINNLILVLVGISYPFYKQTSNYQKINQSQVNK